MHYGQCCRVSRFSCENLSRLINSIISRYRQSPAGKIYLSFCLHYSSGHTLWKFKMGACLGNRGLTFPLQTFQLGLTRPSGLTVCLFPEVLNRSFRLHDQSRFAYIEVDSPTLNTCYLSKIVVMFFGRVSHSDFAVCWTPCLNKRTSVRGEKRLTSLRTSA